MSSKLRVQSETGHPGVLGSDAWGVAPVASPSHPAKPAGYEPSQSGGYEDARADGEALRSIGALSAPPPPGFNPGPGDKSRWTSNPELLWSQDDGIKGLAGSSGRTSSFTNLAAALGSGLAESMEDATRGEHAALTDNFFQNPEKDINYARQNRHAASRLLGSSPSKDAFGPSHKAAEAGSLFASLDSGERGFPKKSSAGQPALFGDFSRNRANGDATSGLSAAFSNDSTDRMAGYRPTYQHKSSSSSHDGNADMMNSRLATTKDLGMTVMEPSDAYGRGGPLADLGGLGVAEREPRRTGDGTYEMQRDMQNLWSGRNSDNQKSSNPSNGGDGIAATQMEAEEELRPFTWDIRHHETSRALAIMRAAALNANDVRAICESYGVIDNFRSDFVDKGVFFVSYYDMRCSQYAAMDLRTRFQKLGAAADGVLVQFCVPLNSSSQNDESLVVLMDVPRDMNIDSLASMLSSYGAVRSLKSLGSNYGGSSFVVEYHDMQDAKQAVLELESTQPWGPNVSVETGARNPSDRKRGRELLALIGRWRHGGGGSRPPPRQAVPSETPRTSYIPGAHAPRHDVRYERSAPQDQPPQLVLGPDGRYSYVVVNHSGYPPQGGGHSHYGERVTHAGPGNYMNHVNHTGGGQQYWAPQAQHFSSGGSVVSQSSYSESQGHYPSGTRSLPYYNGGDGASSVGSRGSHLVSMPHPSSSSAGGDRDKTHLVLDLDAVENGRDSRTSLMVRNIPNKYTQQMLLSEFAENSHGPGTIDFFYLPIDFKNRCNRGYAFINFVDYRDILPFHRRYYGKHWRTFNSDKICDITYARIQGKSAMLKRFENSALMEKDDEYKPLVFMSHGADKGARLPFPDPSTKG